MLGKLHRELRDQIRKRKTEVIEQPTAKRVKKEEARELETLFDQAMGTGDMFETHPFKPIEESKQGPPRPEIVPASAANHFHMPQPCKTAPSTCLWQQSMIFRSSLTQSLQTLKTIWSIIFGTCLLYTSLRTWILITLRPYKTRQPLSRY